METSFDKFDKKIENKKFIKIIGYPEGNIIRVTEDELELLQEEDLVVWDEAEDYKDLVFGQWSFDNEREEELEEWLNIYRNIGEDAIEDVKKYNL
jgi:hypothetical protein